MGRQFFPSNHPKITSLEGSINNGVANPLSQSVDNFNLSEDKLFDQRKLINQGENTTTTDFNMAVTTPHQLFIPEHEFENKNNESDRLNKLSKTTTGFYPGMKQIFDPPTHSLERNENEQYFSDSRENFASISFRKNNSTHFQKTMEHTPNTQWMSKMNKDYNIPQAVAKFGHSNNSVQKFRKKNFLRIKSKAIKISGIKSEMYNELLNELRKLGVDVDHHIKWLNRGDLQVRSFSLIFLDKIQG